MPSPTYSNGLPNVELGPCETKPSKPHTLENWGIYNFYRNHWSRGNPARAHPLPNLQSKLFIFYFRVMGILGDLCHGVPGTILSWSGHWEKLLEQPMCVPLFAWKKYTLPLIGPCVYIQARAEWKLRVWWAPFLVVWGHWCGFPEMNPKGLQWLYLLESFFSTTHRASEHIFFLIPQFSPCLFILST